MIESTVTRFGASDATIHASEILFSCLWLAGLVIVARTGATAIRLGVYLGATFYAFLWDWIQGQSWFFRTTFDDRLTSAFTLDGREEPLFAPLAYGFVFGTLAVVGLTVFPVVHQRLGAWTYVVFGLCAGALDILVEGGVAVTLLDMYVMDYDEGWKILNLPWIVPLYVAIMDAVLLYAVVSLNRLLVAARAGTGGPVTTRDPAGVWLICLVLPAGVNYVAVVVCAAVFNSFTPW